MLKKNILCFYKSCLETNVIGTAFANLNERYIRFSTISVAKVENLLTRLHLFTFKIL